MKKHISRTITCSLAFALALMLCLSLSPATAAAADASDSSASLIPENVQIDEVIEFDPTNADVLVEKITRGPTKPTELFDLEDQNYSVSANWAYSIYTNYYFYPNDDGEIRWNFSVVFPSSYTIQKSFTVECWDKTTNSKVASTKFYTEYIPAEDMYNWYIDTGSYKTYNLNTDHQYYYRFVKTNDTIYADLTGTIKH